MDGRYQKHSAVRDMTTGDILGHMLFFALPLLAGNIFQLLYNTVDTLVVGNFVSTQALAAVGSTSVIVNILVFFFNGLSIGAGVVISQSFGAGDAGKLKRAVGSTMALTLILCILFTIFGLAFTGQMLVFMATPADVLPEAKTYLSIYFSGISGLLIYNMGSGILRAVGDSKRPLFFLALTSLLNILGDLLFVLVFGLGITGAALATIISQFISALLVLFLLISTDNIYKLEFSVMRLDASIISQVFAIGLPAAFQSMITAFSNVFVQAYINSFGSACMAGWSCYNKLNQYAMLPIQSMASAGTTFVGQNTGAGLSDRVQKGTRTALVSSLSITFCIVSALVAFAEQAVSVFSADAGVIAFGSLFIRWNCMFLCFNSINHVLAGCLRGRGDSKGPMIIMISCFVVIRQIYLFVIARLCPGSPILTGLGYPVGWTACCAVELIYFFIIYGRKRRA